MSRLKLTIDIKEPIELSTLRDIKTAILEALEEERAIILQNAQNRAWSRVLEILHGEAKQRFADKTDRIKMLELGMAKMTTTVEGLASEIRASNSKTRS
jgi:hypothetical protein